MLISRDLHTQVEYVPVVSSGMTLGETIIQYEIQAYTDTRNLGDTKAYIVTCTQRLMLPNPNVYDPKAGPTTNFLNYPGLITNSIRITDPNKVIQSQRLLDYTPRTLNTAVSTSNNVSLSQNSSVSQQSTTGSSTAQTNSYGGSVSLGFFGDLPTGDVSANYQYSSTTEQSRSHSTGSAIDRGTQLSNSNAMTIKDWGSYGSVDALDQSPTWVWGQEFPWNIIRFKGTDSNGNIALPEFVRVQLYDGNIVYPPSELSLFGVDFVSKATWLVTPIPGQAGAETIAFEHTLIYGAASHSVSNKVLTANLTTYLPITHTSASLDLAVLALDPIQPDRTSPAVVGFVPNQFDAPPTSAGGAFAITADTNDLLVRGSGFNTIMSTDFTTGAVTMTLSFKIIDPIHNVSLSIKHWIRTANPVQLSFVVNGNTASPFVRFVDTPETGSGGDNIMVVALRNKDFTSVDYCDYLQMGLNTVTITVTAVTTATPSGYQVMALALG